MAKAHLSFVYMLEFPSKVVDSVGELMTGSPGGCFAGDNS